LLSWDRAEHDQRSFFALFFLRGFFTLVHRQLVAEKRYLPPIVAIFYISEARMLKRQMQMQFLLLPAFFSFANFYFYFFAIISPAFLNFNDVPTAHIPQSTRFPGIQTTPGQWLSIRLVMC